MEINESIIDSLKKNNVSLTQYFVLFCLDNDKEQWYRDLKEDRTVTFQFLIRRGFITSDYKITELGLKLLNQKLLPKTVKKPLNSQEKLEEWYKWFTEFWNLYPASDKFRHWERTRSLRVNKIKSFKLFKEILERGEITYYDLKQALLADIKAKQDSSILENQFKYMQAITSWLSKGIYEGYISELKNESNNLDDDRTVFE
jgi:hypothetical protein